MAKRENAFQGVGKGREGFAARNRIAAILFAVLLTALAAFLAGCGDGRRTSTGPGGSGPGPGADELTRAGWLAFEEGDFEKANSDFTAAAKEDSSFAEAYSGAGWAKLGLGRLAGADSAFVEALIAGLENADPHAGRAVALRDLEPPDLSKALFSARDALAIAPRYVFPHDSTFTWHDLRLIIGQAAFELGAYATANDQIDSLGGNVQDEQSPTYVEDLLLELERLGEAIR